MQIPYEAIVAQAAEAIIFADREGLIRVWNRAAEHVFGFTAEQALGASLDLIIPERLRKAHWEAFDRAIESGVAKHPDRVRTTRALHADGQPRYVDMSFGVVVDDQGKALGALALGRDCTERYLAERAKREADQAASGSRPAAS